MPLDVEFVAAARERFNPFLLSSGTELVSPLLYSLARMLRPRTVVEYGSGYSTLFILRALADNIEDVEAEQRSLCAKTRETRILDRCDSGTSGQSGDAKAAMLEWLASGGVACAVDPDFYLRSYAPHLFSFECLPGNHEYVKRMRCAVKALGHQSLFTQICGQSFRRQALPADVLPIDWAWNDHDDYLEFFAEFWDCLNPSGGIMIFHNVPGGPANYETVQSMAAQRAPYGDLQCLILQEPHKMSQNGCAILRRTTSYRPRFALTYKGGLPVLSQPAEILQALRTLFAE